MNLCLSGLPILKNAIYLTYRIKPTHKPSLSIPLNFLHLFARSLYYDSLISQYELVKLINSLYTLYEWNIDVINLDILETIDYEREKLIKFLRGYFTNDKYKTINDTAFIPYVPGLENTSILALLSYNNRIQRFVIDLRDVTVKQDLLKDIIALLNRSEVCEIFVVVDSLSRSLSYNTFNKIYIGPNADVKKLSEIFNDISVLSSDIRLVKRGFIYQSEASDVNWFTEEDVKYSAKWDKPGELDYLSIIFVTGRGDDERIVEGIVNILMDIYVSGGLHEREVIDKLTDTFGYMAMPILYLLSKYGFLKSVVGPMGKSYVVSNRGVEAVLKRYREGRV